MLVSCKSPDLFDAFLQANMPGTLAQAKLPCAGSADLRKTTAMSGVYVGIDRNSYLGPKCSVPAGVRALGQRDS